MLNLAERPEVLFRAPLKIIKLAPVTKLIETFITIERQLISALKMSFKIKMYQHIYNAAVK